MKDIFKYPNNSSTQYIDPNFIGNDTEGFQKRIKDLIDGTYKTHLNSTAKGSVANTMNFIGRFHNATELEEDSGNNTIYKFWEQPLVEFTMQPRDPMIKDVSTEVITETQLSNTSAYNASIPDTLIPKLKVEFQRAHNLSSGDAIKVLSGNTTSAWANFTASSNNLFAQVINSTEIHLSNIATPGFITATKKYTSAGTITLDGGSNSYSDWGISAADKIELRNQELPGNSNARGLCRVKATVNSGTFTGKSSSSKTIPTGTFSTEIFAWRAFSGDIEIASEAATSGIGSSQNIQDFILADAGSGVDVDIEIQFIIPKSQSHFVIPEFNTTIYDIAEIGGSGSYLGVPGTQVIRRDTSAGAGTVLKTNKRTLANDFNSTTAGRLASGSAIKLKTAFTGTHSGTANSTSTTFFTKPVTGKPFQHELYTDASFSTPATLTETLIATATKKYTSAGTVRLTTDSSSSETIMNVISGTPGFASAWGLTSSEVSALEQLYYNGGGFCRVKATVNSGTFTGSDQSDKTITTSIDYTDDFYFKISPGSVASFQIYNGVGPTLDEPTQIVQDFILADAGSGVDVDIEIQFIKSAITDNSYYRNDFSNNHYASYYRALSDNTTDANTKLFKASETTLGFEVATANVFNPGNKTFFKQTGASTQTAAAAYSGVYYEAGDTSSTNGNTSSETMPPDSTITVNSSGFITGFAFTDSVFRGIFTNANTKYFPIMQGTDTYSAPAISTAAQEDVFDLDTEWDTNGFSNLKTWPDTVLPSSIQMKYNQPSQTTSSQNGVKYVRNLGFTKWAMEVTYPPMTESQFAVYHSAAQKAKGQFVPFQFDIMKSNNGFFLDFHDANTTKNIRLKDDSTASNNTVLLEGFANNETINEGELMIMGSTINGNIHTITNSGLSNIYGEFKARLAYPIGTAMTASQQAYLDPEHLVVTLGEDGFEYAKDTNGFYYVKIKLDLDQYKG